VVLWGAQAASSWRPSSGPPATRTAGGRAIRRGEGRGGVNLLRRCFYVSNQVPTPAVAWLWVGRQRRCAEERRGGAGRAGASGGALYRGAGEGPGVARTLRVAAVPQTLSCTA
jgi:hypothetical protein